MSVPKDKLLDMYRTMVRIRTFEERVAKEFAAGKIPGFVHLYIGEEAIAAGACANLRLDDYITSTHRGHGHMIAKGGRTDRMMAELYAKGNGYCKGKGGSMHIADMDIGILGANGIVGAGITIAGGAALATHIRRTDQITVCFFGDGATNTSRFHEGINFASYLNLAVVYVIENNMYAVSTPISQVCNITNLADRASGYGIPGVTVDGNSVLAVYEAVGAAVKRARNGGGPSLIECKTYRYHGHFDGDPQSYKPKGEAEGWMQKDPIVRFRKRLFDMGVITEQDAKRIIREAEKEMDKAVKYAAESPYPAPEETLEDVYA